MKSEKWAWLAGILDGEGTIAAYGFTGMDGPVERLRIRPQIAITNTNLDILREAQRLTSGTIVRRKRDTNPNHKPNHDVTIKGNRRISYVLRQTLPYLVGKKLQAKLVLELVTLRRAGVRYGPREFEIVNELKKLNARGMISPSGDSMLRFEPTLDGRVRSGGRKLTVEKVLEIRRKFKTGKFTQAQLSRFYDVDSGTVSKIINGHYWKNVEHIRYWKNIEKLQGEPKDFPEATV